MTATVATPSLNTSQQWISATWEEYLSYVENPDLESQRVFFNLGRMWVEMGNEGINHSQVNKLLTMLLFVWFSQKPGVKFQLLGGCVIEKPGQQGAAPDEVLYVGEGYPVWQVGEPRRVNLDRWRVPDLVVEVADTTLAIDLDEKKQLYLALGILEYWVIDVKGPRVLAFRLIDGVYQQVLVSVVLAELPIELIEQTLSIDEANGNAAMWFSEQVQSLFLT
jgi:Uma2 family endonuclease